MYIKLGIKWFPTDPFDSLSHLFWLMTLAQTCCTLLLPFTEEISKKRCDGSAYGAHSRIAVPSKVTGKRCG